ncbi:MAG TPA: molybdopterin-dependent oxidoreductase [Candidatus Dormibacteraeota bacterium]|nr:molybdopterin-dependent oxidoreductase [Candidatus Dormibacteraeota bacterium]
MSRVRRDSAWRGFAWGCVGGIALVALMYLAELVLALRPLPQLLNEPLLSLMPGFVFGFLIDTLQHAGKVVEEFGLILAMIVALGVLGAASSVAALRWRSRYLPLAFAAAGWLVVVVVFLPLGGAGFLGLTDGPATPIVWAALFAVYGVILQMGGDAPGGVDPGRRRILSTLPLTIGALGLGVLAVRLVPGWYQAVFNPPEAGLAGPSPELTPVKDFYVVSKNFADPVVDGQTWRLHVGGLVDRQLTLSLAELRGLTALDEYVTLECISNNVGGALMSTGGFTGISLRDLVSMASPKPNGTWVAFSARDGYTESLRLDLVNSSPEIMVAYDLDGAPLPMSHGYPARMLIPGHYGMKGPKWLERIDLVDRESGGYWEQQGWDHNALVKTTSRIDAPQDGVILKLGPVAISGVAFAGKRGVSKVEYSTDGGSTWSEATANTPLSPFTWVLWQATWTPAGEGAYSLVVRATDGTGAVQQSGGAASYPSGAQGYHSIHVDVSKA